MMSKVILRLFVLAIHTNIGMLPSTTHVVKTLKYVGEKHLES